MEVFKKIIVARINLPDHGVLKFLWYSCLHKYNFDASVVQITNNTELKWWHCRQRIRLPMVMTELVLSFSCDVLSITVYEIILWDKQWSLLNLVGKLPKNMEYFVINSIINMQYCFTWTQPSDLSWYSMSYSGYRIQFNFMLTLKGAVRIELIHIQYCFMSTQPSNLSWYSMSYSGYSTTLCWHSKELWG